MENRAKDQSWYLTVGGKRITVSKEVYLAYRAENNRVHKRAHREQRCAQPNYAHCDGDCLTCSWHNAGILLSTDAPLPDHHSEKVSDNRFEDGVIEQITMSRVYEQADQLVKEGSTILQMRFEEGVSVREIAERLNVSHTAINKRMKIMLNYFKTNRENFF